MMAKKFSQWVAFQALTIAALRSIAKSPSSIIFTIAFPLIFILVFGFFGDSRMGTIPIAFVSGTHLDHPLVKALSTDGGLEIVRLKNNAELNKALASGKLTAVLDIRSDRPGHSYISIVAAEGREQQLSAIHEKINAALVHSDASLQKNIDRIAAVNQKVVKSRSNRMIDFILPGQLGFSLLAASVFGTAFVFFNLRQTLVLKRFFATPVLKVNILLAEGMARVIFQLAGALVIILIGHYFLGFTLAKGGFTVINMLILSSLGLLIFMSFGFIISGLARSESVIPPLSNIVTLPQFLLAGTFFSVDKFPSWIQPVSYALPLTYFNDAMRKISLEGASLWSVKFDLLILLIWGVVGYTVAGRVFRWE